MRGGDNRTGKLFSYVDLEARVRRDHPLRAIRTIVIEALEALEREFVGLYGMPRGRNRRSRKEDTYDRNPGQPARHPARFTISPLLANIYMRRLVLGWKMRLEQKASALASRPAPTTL